MRFRIRTLMVTVTIIGLVTALAVQAWRAQHTEAILRALVQDLESNKAFDERVIKGLMELQRDPPAR